MQKIIFLFVLTVLFVGAGAMAQTSAGVVCSQNWEPVCGADGKTYTNGCTASVAGIKYLYRGECGSTPSTGSGQGGSPQASKPVTTPASTQHTPIVTPTSPIAPSIDLNGCAYYFDGCNNCQVTDGKITYCTKMACGTIAPAKCIKTVAELKNQTPTAQPVYNNTIPKGCVSWYDGCNTCSVKDGKADICTQLACIRQAEPKCLKFAETSTAPNTTANNDQLSALKSRLEAQQRDINALREQINSLMKQNESIIRRLNELAPKK